MLYSLAPVSGRPTFDSKVFAFEYEPRIAPCPIGTAKARPYCLAFTSPSPARHVFAPAPVPVKLETAALNVPTAPLPLQAYLLSSNAKPRSTTPKFQPPLTAQPVSELPMVV